MEGAGAEVIVMRTVLLKAKVRAQGGRLTAVQRRQRPQRDGPVRAQHLGRLRPEGRHVEPVRLSSPVSSVSPPPRACSALVPFRSLPPKRKQSHGSRSLDEFGTNSPPSPQ